MLRWIRRYLLVGGVIVLLGTVTFGGLPVYADPAPANLNGTSTLDSSSTEGSSDTEDGRLNLVSMLERGLKVSYLILWPLLAIAGASLDNSLVYGEIFYLDRTLWQFRQMMRNFANFALGFVFLISIIIAFLRIKNEKLELKRVLKNVLIAGILINMSRWVVAVLIDLSTVMTVSVGALPLNVVGNEKVINTDGEEVCKDEDSDEVQLCDVRYLKIFTVFNMDSTVDQQRDQVEHSVMFSCPDTPGGMRYLPCLIKNDEFVEEGNEEEPDSWKGYKKQFVESWQALGDEEITTASIRDDYCVYGYDLIPNEFGEQVTLSGLAAGKAAGREVMREEGCSTIDELIQDAQGMSGPLFSLFATILNMGENALTPNNQSTVEIGLTFLMQLLISLALIIPLLALAIILIVRAVILWLIIVFSPFLVLVYTFDFKRTFGGFGDEKTSLRSVLGLIFLPVFAVFAISISIIFLTLMGRLELIEKNETEDIMSPLGIQRIVNDGGESDLNKQCYEVLNITTICLTSDEQRTGSNILNVMTWLTVNFFGIALMWTAVFFALKSSKITEGIASSVQGIGMGMAKAMPIVPTGMGLASIGSLQRTLDRVKDMPKRKAQLDFQNSAMKEYLDSIEQQFSGNIDDADKKVGSTVSSGTTTASDLKGAVAADSNYQQYNHLGSGMVVAAKSAGYDVKVDKDDSIEEIRRDPGVRRFLQDNDLDTHENWVKQNKLGADERYDWYDGLRDSLEKDPDVTKSLSKLQDDQQFDRYVDTKGDKARLISMRRAMRGGQRVGTPQYTNSEFDPSASTAKSWQTFSGLVGSTGMSWEEIEPLLTGEQMRVYKEKVNEALAGDGTVTLTSGEGGDATETKISISLTEKGKLQVQTPTASSTESEGDTKSGQDTEQQENQ